MDEVTKLGKKYGVVTPWTSHLVAEEAERLAANTGLDAGPCGTRHSRESSRGAGLLGGLTGRRQDAGPGAGDPSVPTGPSTGNPPPSTPSGPATPAAPSPQAGAEAVGKSKLLDRMRKAESLDSEQDDKAGQPGAGRIRRLGSKLFLLLEETWTDQAFEPAMKEGLTTIEAFSPDYFALLQKHPEAGPLAGSGRADPDRAGWPGLPDHALKRSPAPRGPGGERPGPHSFRPELVFSAVHQSRRLRARWD